MWHKRAFVHVIYFEKSKKYHYSFTKSRYHLFGPEMPLLGICFPDILHMCAKTNVVGCTIEFFLIPRD